MTAPLEIGDDDPVSLADAVKIFFPHARLTKSALRTEAAKGNLEIIKIANKDFVTRNGIRGMLEKCRAKKSPPGSVSGQTPDSGSSRTEPGVSPQDALRAKLKARKKPSGTMSAKNTNPSGVVVPLRSR
jgi:hypothetical protein